MIMAESAFTFFGEISDVVLVVIFAAVFVAGFLRGFLGFGGSLLIVLVVNATVGPHMAVPLACLSGLPATIQLLPDAIRYSDRSFALPFGAMSLVFVPVGTWLLFTIDVSLMKVMISLTVLAMVLCLYRDWKAASLAHPIAIGLAGAVAGLVQGVAGAGGPLAVALALGYPGSAENQRGNVLGALTFLASAPVISLWSYGLFTREVVFMSIVAIPLYSGATVIGQRYFSSRGHLHYRYAALGALTLASLISIVVTIRDYVI